MIIGYDDVDDAVAIANDTGVRPCRLRVGDDTDAVRWSPRASGPDRSSSTGPDRPSTPFGGYKAER